MFLLVFSDYFCLPFPCYPIFLLLWWTIHLFTATGCVYAYMCLTLCNLDYGSSWFKILTDTIRNCWNISAMFCTVMAMGHGCLVMLRSISTSIWFCTLYTQGSPIAQLIRSVEELSWNTQRIFEWLCIILQWSHCLKKLLKTTARNSFSCRSFAT